MNTSWGGKEHTGRLNVPSDRMRFNGHKLKDRNINLHIREPFSPVWDFEKCDRFLRVVVESPPLKISKKQLHTDFSNVL